MPKEVIDTKQVGEDIAAIISKVAGSLDQETLDQLHVLTAKLTNPIPAGQKP